MRTWLRWGLGFGLFYIIVSAISRGAGIMGSLFLVLLNFPWISITEGFLTQSSYGILFFIAIGSIPYFIIGSLIGLGIEKSQPEVKEIIKQNQDKIPSIKPNKEYINISISIATGIILSFIFRIFQGGINYSSNIAIIHGIIAGFLANLIWKLKFLWLKIILWFFLLTILFISLVIFPWGGF